MKEERDGMVGTEWDMVDLGLHDHVDFTVFTILAILH